MQLQQHQESADSGFTPMDGAFELGDEDGDFTGDNAEGVERPMSAPTPDMGGSDLEALLEPPRAVLGDLDALLAESVESASLESAARAARERLRRGNGSSAERLEDAARIEAWEAAHDWLPQANVALFHTFACDDCDSAVSVFQGLFCREVHKRHRTGERYRRVEQAQASLKNEVADREVKVPMCPNCAERKGYDTEQTYDIEG